MSLRTRTLGIIGGGPAGLSLARVLAKNPALKVTVLEAEPQVGGKSKTGLYAETLIEHGTCYATTAHRQVLKWMKALNVPTRPMGALRFDGRPFIDYVKEGSGAPLAVQSVKYLRETAKLKRALEEKTPPQWALDQAAEPALQWLNKRKLGKIERMLHRTQTALGYGFLSEVPMIHVQRWNDLDLILTGVFDLAKMPTTGWQEFWAILARDLEVTTGFRAAKIERGETRCVVTSADGREAAFDEIVCAIPIDEFLDICTAPSDLENAIRGAIKWHKYTTTLIASPNWFDDVAIEAFKEAIVPGAPLGKVLSGRFETSDEAFGGALYTVGQLPGAYSDAELQELLRADLAERGIEVANIVYQKTWKYFAEYDSEAVRNGLLSHMKDVQGRGRTWYTGSAFSHEAVSNIVNFNLELAKSIRTR